MSDDRGRAPLEFERAGGGRRQLLGEIPDVYPAGTHLESTTVALSRERVRRARLGMELLQRSGLEVITSELGAEGLAVPLAAGN